MTTLKMLFDACEDWRLYEYKPTDVGAVGERFSLRGTEYQITEDFTTPKGVRLIGLKGFCSGPVLHKGAVFYEYSFWCYPDEIRQKAGYIEYPGTNTAEGFFPGTVLMTRDGRRIGNAIVYDRYDTGMFGILTDFGNSVRMNVKEVKTCFHTPTRRISHTFFVHRCKLAGIESAATDY